MRLHSRAMSALCLACVSGMLLTGCDNDLIDSLFNPANSLTVPPTVNAKTAFAYVEDAQTVYDSIQYNYRMFYGKYIAPDVKGQEFTENGADTYLKVASKIPKDWHDNQRAVLPFRIEAGPHSFNSSLNYVTGYNWMLFYFLGEDGTVLRIPAAYTVLDKTLTLHPVDEFSYDGYTKTLDYSFTDLIWKYDFSFSNGQLTLYCGENSITFTAEDLADPEQNVYFYEARCRDNYPPISGIQGLRVNGADHSMIMDTFESPDISFQFGDDGLLKMQWIENTVLKSAQFAYFYCDDDGFICSDGISTFDYTARENNRLLQQVTINLSSKGASNLDTLSPNELQTLANTIEHMYNDLAQQFSANNIEVTVDKETGEIALSSLVLFNKNECEISEKGKELLRNFLTVYTSVLFDSKYADLISEIVVEGYTDPSGAADYNMLLSEQRANEVMNFCLSENNGISADDTQKLAEKIQAVGKGFENPVKDSQGLIMMEASRRVSFRFKLDIN